LEKQIQNLIGTAEFAPLSPPGDKYETQALRIVFDSGLFRALQWKRYVIDKPEVGLHNISHYRKRRTEPRPHRWMYRKFDEIYTVVLV